MIESWGYGNPTDQQVQDLVNLFVTNAMLTRDKAFFKHVDNALIVIAAGNSTENNDGLVISPNNVDLPNTLIIAATNQDKAIANFSCFGVKTVDVAVPGVNIYSSYPNGKMGFMSGTSMAAPLASRYAAMILQANPALTPVQLKTIIMKTVDKKSWLKDKVKSGGVINVTRAIAAAKSMKDGVKMNQAILTAGTEVEDAIKANPFDLFEAPKFETEFEKALYNSAIF
jgi:subtilisin family serine protease